MNIKQHWSFSCRRIGVKWTSETSTDCRRRSGLNIITQPETNPTNTHMYDSRFELNTIKPAQMWLSRRYKKNPQKNTFTRRYDVILTRKLICGFICSMNLKIWFFFLNIWCDYCLFLAAAALQTTCMIHQLLHPASCMKEERNRAHPPIPPKPAGGMKTHI